MSVSHLQPIRIHIDATAALNGVYIVDRRFKAPGESIHQVCQSVSHFGMFDTCLRSWPHKCWSFASSIADRYKL